MSLRRMRSRSPRRRARNHRTRRRLARNRRRCRRRSHNIGSLPRLRHNLSRTLWSRRHMLCRSARRRCHCRNCRWLRSSRSRHMMGCRRSHHRRTWRHRRNRLRGCFSLLALQDRLQSIARLRYLRQVKLRLGLCGLLRHGTSNASAAQICADLLRFIGLDRAGVRLLLGDAHRHQSVQNRLALHFQFACQIVDSNFAHPSLFVLPLRLSCSYRPLRRRNGYMYYL